MLSAGPAPSSRQAAEHALMWGGRWRAASSPKGRVGVSLPVGLALERKWDGQRHLRAAGTAGRVAHNSLSIMHVQTQPLPVHMAPSCQGAHLQHAAAIRLLHNAAAVSCAGGKGHETHARHTLHGCGRRQRRGHSAAAIRAACRQPLGSFLPASSSLPSALLLQATGSGTQQPHPWAHLGRGPAAPCPVQGCR